MVRTRTSRPAGNAWRAAVAYVAAPVATGFAAVSSFDGLGVDLRWAAAGVLITVCSGLWFAVWQDRQPDASDDLADRPGDAR
jgi:protein-S-isoprenylcysteine O-methyltransferase Ste14